MPSRFTKRRNMHTIYIREENFPIWDEFLTLIKTDNELIQKQDDKNQGKLISLGIMQGIKLYVAIRKGDARIQTKSRSVVVENETN